MADDIKIDIGDPQIRTNFPDVVRDFQIMVGVAGTVDVRDGVYGRQVLDVGSYRAVALTLIGPAVIEIPPSSALQALCVLVLTIRQGSGAPHAVEWPDNITWAGNYAPALSLNTGGLDVIQLMSTDGGATWFGGRLTQMGS